jgi:hypothetical protein
MTDHIWTIKDERALEIIHELLIQELSDKPKQYLPLQELLSSLNRNGKQYMIHKQKKHNCWSKYIKIRYGSFESFLENFGPYELVKDDKTKKTYVYYKENRNESFEFVPRFTKDKDWVFIE